MIAIFLVCALTLANYCKQNSSGCTDCYGIRCLACAPGYKKSMDLGICFWCVGLSPISGQTMIQAQNCAQCGGIGRECIVCAEGYTNPPLCNKASCGDGCICNGASCIGCLWGYGRAGEACAACSDNCGSCNGSVCVECKEEYYLDDNSGQCIRGNITGCVIYNSSTQCRFCASGGLKGMVFYGNSSPMAAVNLQNTNLYAPSSGTCANIHFANDTNCSIFSNKKCLACNEGYGVTYNHTAPCRMCTSQNCAHCVFREINASLLQTCMSYIPISRSERVAIGVSMSVMVLVFFTGCMLAFRFIPFTQE